MNEFVVPAVIATLGTWFLTAVGAAAVIFFKSQNQRLLNIMLGFAAGVMIAASFFSLLLPAIERAEAHSCLPAWLLASLGFLSGALFIFFCDKIIALKQKRESTPQGDAKIQRIRMLILSITLHNIPEGLAVGVAFGALAEQGGSAQSILGAVSVAVGIGLQNLPEGAAVSIPLRREGYSRGKSFFLGQASGAVEPISGFIGAIAVVYIESLLPYALSFAAGAMILVAAHELIPEAQSDQATHPYSATMGIVFGFATMMLLDVMLG